MRTRRRPSGSHPTTALRGKQKAAEQLAMRFMSVSLRQRPYQPFADLRFQFPGHEGRGIIDAS
jgi:hypothetical protein